MPPPRGIKEDSWIITHFPPYLKQFTYPLIRVFIAQRKRLSHPDSDLPRPSPSVFKVLLPLAKRALEGLWGAWKSFESGELWGTVPGACHRVRSLFQAQDELGRAVSVAWRPGLPYKAMCQRQRGFQPQKRWRGGVWLGVRPRGDKDGVQGTLLCPSSLGFIFPFPFSFIAPRLSSVFPFTTLLSTFSPLPTMLPTDASLLTAPLQPPRLSHSRLPCSLTPRSILRHPLWHPLPNLLFALGLLACGPARRRVRKPTDPDDLDAQRGTELSPGRAIFNYLFGHRGEL